MDYQGALPTGEYTSTIYTAIRDERYKDAIDILNFEMNVSFASFLILNFHIRIYNVNRIFQEVELD